MYFVWGYSVLVTSASGELSQEETSSSMVALNGRQVIALIRSAMGVADRGRSKRWRGRLCGGKGQVDEHRGRMVSDHTIWASCLIARVRYRYSTSLLPEWR